MTEEYTVTIRQKGTNRVVSEKGRLDQWAMHDALRIAHQTLSEVGARIIHVTASSWDPRNYRISYR
ncbi:hypothetical protein FJZ22_00935 [Candidatus Pacearchaeota archaeon]|nr:hypothetical protein [Candidatus Pacearchaeota archaeon]